MCYQVRFVDINTDEEVLVVNSEKVRIPQRGEVVSIKDVEYKVTATRTVYAFGDDPCYIQIFIEKSLTYLC